ncbi:MAG: glycosyltransferase [Candidatus Atribacteria bacterium]|nr:glycosyltransferase [Candidatus Atribacteria bacterium]
MTGNRNQLLISIITPSLNRADMIVTAIESVLAQNYPYFEHIIIDGGSTDGTLNVLGKYPHLRLISELDRGMYDAINKGLALASGEIIGFLNTDDLFADDIFAKVAKKFDDDRILVVAGGPVIIF